MNKWLDWRPLLGLLLIIAGLFYLVQVAFHIPVGSLFFAVVLGAGGVLFLLYYFRNRAHWWPILPGVILVSMALGQVLDVLLPFLPVNFGGVFFLLGIGLSFLIVYLINHNNWWAIIPAGVMYTLAAVNLVQSFFAGMGTGGIFFLGLGLTFAVLSILPTGRPGERLRWALIPGGILVLMGLIFAGITAPVVNLVWPVLLILVGLIFLYHTLTARRA